MSTMKSVSIHTPLESNKVLSKSLIAHAQAGSASQKRSLLFSMNLTTLIDAFCILVIFLLSNMNGRLDNLQHDQNLILPSTSKADDKFSEVVVKVTKEGFSIDEKMVTIPELIRSLKAKGQKALIIQADKSRPYSDLSQVIRAAGLSGYESYLFAVLPGKEI